MNTAKPFGALVFAASLLAAQAAAQSGLRGVQPEGGDTGLISQAAPAQDGLLYVIRHTAWTESDETAFGEFVTRIGDSGCRTVNTCLKSSANPFRASDPPDLTFKADCADLPYFLRAYFAWKRGLPFAYTAEVSPLGRSRDIRYSPRGNVVERRIEVLTGTTTGPALLARLRDTISSAMYRVHPSRETPVAPDHYSAALSSGSIRPGTVIYDPNGHLGVVYRVEADGRVLYIDAHPDNSLTRGTYDKRFVRARPAMSAGFKNWRSVTLVGATRDALGRYQGGRIVAATNAQSDAFSLEQFYGTGAETSDETWNTGAFTLNGEAIDYYDYVRAVLSGGALQFKPLEEVAAMVRANCADLQYRAEAVQLSRDAGLDRRPHPARLPSNIYGTDGDWETYSTPSRDARLKTAFKELRDRVERFLTMHETGDTKLIYEGGNLAADLLQTYQREAGACSVTYVRTDGAAVAMSYEEASKRLFRMSFDPYHCIELRWGASTAAELASCPDGAQKRAWFAAQAGLRNQLERSYEARMDHDLEELSAPGGEGKGVDAPPDVDVRAFLISALNRSPDAQSRL